jgi:hypothetical protein
LQRESDLADSKENRDVNPATPAGLRKRGAEKTKGVLWTPSGELLAAAFTAPHLMKFDQAYRRKPI